MASVSSDETDLYRQVDDYPWESDEEFQSGLEAILGSHPSQEQAESLTLQAKCFYYARFAFPVSYTKAIIADTIIFILGSLMSPLISKATKPIEPNSKPTSTELNPLLQHLKDPQT